MGRKKYPPNRRQLRQRFDLDRPLDTSGTQPSVTLGNRKEDFYEKSESVPPPFKGGDSSQYIKKSDFSLVWKAVVSAVGIFVVAASVIWFAAGLNKDVSNLIVEVGEIKNKTDKLLEGVIRNEERLTNAERSINVIAKSMQEKQRGLPDKQIPLISKPQPSNP